MQFLRQSTLTKVWLGPFVDGTDGFTLENALNLTGAIVGIAKHGEVLFSSSTNGATFVVNGLYKHDVTAAETDTLGLLSITVIATEIRPVRHDYMVLSQDAYDRQFGTSHQTRVNDPPADAYTLALVSMADGTYKATPPVRFRPGSLTNSPAIGVDMSAQFGKEFVETVGAPTVSAGSITATALGPRDTLAMVQLSGTATADEEQTVTMDVTMESGDKIPVTFDVEVFAD